MKPSAAIIRLFIGVEVCPDQAYEANGYEGRSYFFIQDAAGNRYSERWILPEGLWSDVRLTPLPVNEYGPTLDDRLF